jgi:hypothetical protein
VEQAEKNNDDRHERDDHAGNLRWANTTHVGQNYLSTAPLAPHELRFIAPFWQIRQPAGPALKLSTGLICG